MNKWEFMVEDSLKNGLTQIESKIESREIIPRDNKFYNPCEDGIIKPIMQSEMCREYFGIESKARKNEKNEICYGCFIGEELIWPAGAGCEGPYGTCPVYKELKKFFRE